MGPAGEACFVMNRRPNDLIGQTGRERGPNTEYQTSFPCLHCKETKYWEMVSRK